MIKKWPSNYVKCLVLEYETISHSHLWKEEEAKKREKESFRASGISPSYISKKHYQKKTLALSKMKTKASFLHIHQSQIERTVGSFLLAWFSNSVICASLNYMSWKQAFIEHSLADSTAPISTQHPGCAQITWRCNIMFWKKIHYVSIRRLQTWNSL